MPGSILVVDDDPDFVDLVQTLLRDAYRVEGCTNSTFALQRLRQLNPVLVFLDLNMPEPNGWDLFRAIRNESAFAQLPVLVVSAVGIEGESVEARLRREAPGPVDVLPKPFEIDDLVGKVNDLLGPETSSAASAAINEDENNRVGSTN